jgi:hypothetical protein
VFPHQNPVRTFLPHMAVYTHESHYFYICDWQQKAVHLI